MKRSRAAGGRPTTTAKSHNKLAKTYISADRQGTAVQRNAAKTGKSIASYFVNLSAVEPDRVQTESSETAEIIPGVDTAEITHEGDGSTSNSTTTRTEEDGSDSCCHGLPVESAEKCEKFRDKLITFSRKFPWLEYRYGDGAYCVICKAVSLGSETVKMWSKIPHNLVKDDKWNINFTNHQKSKRHKGNVHVIQMVKKWKSTGKGGIRAQVHEGIMIANKEADRTRNRNLLKHLLKSLLFLIRKRWAARENYEDFLRFIGDHLEHPDLQHHFALMKKNATYLSKTTVDNFLKHIDSFLDDELTTTLKSVSCLTLEADESTSESGNEMLSIYVKFMHPVTHTLEEKFLCQVKMGASKTAKALHQAITQVLQDKGIDCTKIFFVGLDTTNTMSGERGGLQRLLRHSHPMCKYQPCRSHKLALVLVHMMKSNPLLSEMDSLLIAVWKKFKFSTNNKAVLEETQAVEGNKPLKIIKACTTRWLTHGQACRRTSDILPMLLDTLDAVYHAHHDPEIKGVRDQLCRPEMILFILFMADLLTLTNNLCKYLQGRQVQFSSLPQVKGNFIKRVQSFKDNPSSMTDGVFSAKSEDYTLLTQERSVNARRTRARQGQSLEGDPPTDVVKHFWKETAIPFTQEFVDEVNSAFEVPDPVLCAFQSLNPDGFVHSKVSDQEMHPAAPQLKTLFTFYGNTVTDVLDGEVVEASPILATYNMEQQLELQEFCSAANVAVSQADKDILKKADILRDELKTKQTLDIDSQISAFIDKNKMTSAQLFKSLKQLGICEDLFPNIMILLNLASIIPSSTAEVERGFSLMNLLCTPLRASMLPNTLDKLIRICLNGQSLTDKDIEAIIDRFRDDNSITHRRLSL